MPYKSQTKGAWFALVMGYGNCSHKIHFIKKLISKHQCRVGCYKKRFDNPAFTVVFLYCLFLSVIIYPATLYFSAGVKDSYNNDLSSSVKTGKIIFNLPY